MKNRLSLAPLTNTQSHEDGRLSQEELHWLTLRAKGGFGIVMTCAAHVDLSGKGFPGQLGIYSDLLNEGHKTLTSIIHQYDSLALTQLYHGGLRSPSDLIPGAPVAPSDHEASGARSLSTDEVIDVIDAFVNAAKRAQSCGYDGVEIHAAHGYLIAQFISAQYNHRTDEYGGDLRQRCRLLFDIINGIRCQCGDAFVIGVRLSPERFGMDLEEIKTLITWLKEMSSVDFVDLSLWDVRKHPEDEKYADKTLLAHLSDLDYGAMKWTAAGHIRSGADVSYVLDHGADFVTIGRAGIIHPDFALRVQSDAQFSMRALPVSRDYLRSVGVSDVFINYLTKWKDFVEEA